MGPAELGPMQPVWQVQISEGPILPRLTDLLGLHLVIHVNPWLASAPLSTSC